MSVFKKGFNGSSISEIPSMMFLSIASSKLSATMMHDGPFPTIVLGDGILYWYRGRVYPGT
jgi:hypothetical protein